MDSLIELVVVCLLILWKKYVVLPLPLGEGRGEGVSDDTLILTFSQREKEL